MVLPFNISRLGVGGFRKGPNPDRRLVFVSEGEGSQRGPAGREARHGHEDPFLRLVWDSASVVVGGGDATEFTRW